MVIRLGTAQLSVPPTSDFSADCWGPPTSLVRSRQATSAAGGSCRLLITVGVLLRRQDLPQVALTRSSRVRQAGRHANVAVGWTFAASHV